MPGESEWRGSRLAQQRERCALNEVLLKISPQPMASSRCFIHGRDAFVAARRPPSLPATTQSFGEQEGSWGGCEKHKKKRDCGANTPPNPSTQRAHYALRAPRPARLESRPRRVPNGHNRRLGRLQPRRVGAQELVYSGAAGARLPAGDLQLLRRRHVQSGGQDGTILQGQGGDGVQLRQQRPGARPSRGGGRRLRSRSHGRRERERERERDLSVPLARGLPAPAGR